MYNEVEYVVLLGECYLVVFIYDMVKFELVIFYLIGIVIEGWFYCVFIYLLVKYCDCELFDNVNIEDYFVIGILGLLLVNYIEDELCLVI